MKQSGLLLSVLIFLNSCGPVSTAAPLASAISTTSLPVRTPFELTPEATQEVVMPLTLTSPAFTNGQSIPVKYSCRDQDISPQLIWNDSPAGTRSFALITDDPDAPVGTWVHWVIFNIPASARGLNEATPTDEALADGSQQGITSARSHGYHGPCPPSGTHRYFFKLYALDGMLSLSNNADKNQLLKAMEGHILAQAELMGLFSK